jgi:hypothetical protein
MAQVHPWWTVFAVYDDNQEAFVHFTQAKDPDAAWKKALSAAEGPIHRAGVVAGKIYDLSKDDDGVIPIRGRGHAIEVAHVVVTSRHVIIPGRCPGCRLDTRKTAALIETSLAPRKWFAHLSHNGKDLSAERDGRSSDSHKLIETVKIACNKCSHVIWDGVVHG